MNDVSSGGRESGRGGRAGGGGRTRLGGRDLDVTGLPRASSRQYGSSSLICASQYGHLDIVKALLESRADVNAKNNVQTLPRASSPSPPLWPAPLQHAHRTHARGHHWRDADGARRRTHSGALHQSRPPSLPLPPASPHSHAASDAYTVKPTPQPGAGRGLGRVYGGRLGGREGRPWLGGRDLGATLLPLTSF